MAKTDDVAEEDEDVQTVTKKDKKKAKKAAQVEPEEPETAPKKRKKAKAEVEAVEEEEVVPKKKTKKAKQAPSVEEVEEVAEEEVVQKKKGKKQKQEEQQEVEKVPAATEDTTGRKLYLSGIPKSCTEESLKELFGQYGKIQDLKLPGGRGVKRIAFVTFKKKSSAEAALEEDGNDVDGFKMKVRFADGSKRKGDDAPAKAGADTTVFVAGLGLDCNKEALRNHFTSQCGEIEELDVPESKNRISKGQSRGFAIIKFKKKKAADLAMEMHGSDYRGRTLNVKAYTKSASDEKQAAKKAAQKAREEAQKASKKEFRVFARGFPKSTTEALLREHFEPCGEIKHLIIPKKDGTPRGIAFISFTSKAALKEALRLNGQEFRERPLVVAIAGVTSKGGGDGGGGE